MKKWLLTASLLTTSTALAFSTLPITSYTAQATTTVKLGKQVSGSISKTATTQRYQVTVSDAGKFVIDAESKMNATIRVYDGTGQLIFTEMNLNGTDAVQASLSRTVYVEKGTYYIDVNGDGKSAGKYSFTTNFTAVSSNEREPNDIVETAQAIAGGTKISGILSYKDRQDIYRLDMAKPGSLNLSLSAWTNLDIEILDHNKKVILERTTIKGNETSAKKAEYPFLLQDAIYYIKIYATDSSTGKYTLNFDTELYDLSESPTNNVKSVAQELISGKTLMGSTLIDDPTDWYTIDVNKPSKWEVNYDGEKEVNISIYSEDAASLEEYKNYKNFSRIYYLSKGKYYIKIDHTGTKQGLYKLKSKLTTVKSDEGVYNDTMEYAEPLKVGQTKTGILSLVDVADVYAVTVDKTGYLKMNLSTNTTTWLSAYDAQGYTLLNAQYAYGTQSQKATTNPAIKVKKGTYYWFVKKHPYATGEYTIKPTFTKSNPNVKPSLSSVTTPKANAMKVTGKATKGSTVSVKIGKKTYSAKATSKGTFTVKVPKLKKGAKLTVTAKNSFGTSAKKTVTVKK